MLSGTGKRKYLTNQLQQQARIDKNAQTLLNEYGRLNLDSFERNSKTEVMASVLKMLQLNGHQIGCNFKIWSHS